VSDCIRDYIGENQRTRSGLSNGQKFQCSRYERGPSLCSHEKVVYGVDLYTAHSVMSAKASQLGRTSSCIRWKTTDPIILARLHEAVVRLVQEIGLSGLAELAEAARMTQRAQKALPNICDLRRLVSVDISMNTTRPLRKVLPATRNDLRSAGDAMNPSKLGHKLGKYEQIKDLAAMRRYEGWQRDCSMMIDLL
jgi:hypothetical protein